MKSLRTVVILALVVLAVGGVAVVFGLLRSSPPAEELPTAIPPRGDTGTARSDVSVPEEQRGGTFAGVVVDERGEGVAGAPVLLVAFEGRTLAEMRETETDADPLDQEFDPATVPIVDYRAVAEGRTDAAGRFTLAAGASSVVHHVVAYQAGYMPEIVYVKGPSEGIRVVLPGAGRVIGRVVDKETGKPVPGVHVDIYLQNKTAPPPEPGFKGGAGRSMPLSHIASLQTFVAQFLAERVWGVKVVRGSAIPVRTDSEGRFEFGPIGNTVQLEFRLTHPEYAWTDHDLQGDLVRRTVVEPGQTVERTFQLEKGKWIEGRVLDEQGVGLGGVTVAVEHVVQYWQHPEYQIRKRTAVTAPDGSFRVAGLSWGPYVATLTHPSFGTEHVTQIPENSRGNEWHVLSVGSIRGYVEGLQRKPAGMKIEGVMEPTSADQALSHHETRPFNLDASGSFAWRKVRPGKYLVHVRAGTLASQPVAVEVRAREETVVRFPLGGGGRIVASVRDGLGRPVDPATVALVQVGEGGERPLGSFVTRAGELDQEGIVPGRYRLRASAPGYMPVTSEPFDVREDSTTNAGAVQLLKQGALLFSAPMDETGRPVSGPVSLYVQEGGKPEYVVLPELLKQGRLPVAPGRVTVRAVAEDGRSFRQEYDVPDGGTAEVHPVLR